MKAKDYITLLIIFLAVLIRANVYIQNRSLIIDEASLARNVVEKQHSDFFKSLDYQQYAPPLFMTGSKIAIQSFGVNEYALKIIPLVSGIASIFLLLSLLKLFQLNNMSTWYTLLLFAFSVLLIRYSTEFKQYSSDTAICLAFILGAVKYTKRELHSKDILLWAIGGAIGIWASMPLVFVLGAIGLGFFFQSEKSVASIAKLSIIGVFWLVSFGIYFYCILYDDAQNNGLQEFHSRYFFSLSPQSIDDCVKNLKILELFFRNAGGKTAIGVIFSVLTYSAGVYKLFKTQKFELFLLSAPIAFALIASHFHLYSLINRLILFTIPPVLIVMGVGLSHITKTTKPAVKFALIPIMLLILINKGGYKYLFTKMEIENSKALFEILHKNRTENEPIYVQHEGKAVFTFYNHLHDKRYNFKNYFLENNNNLLEPELNKNNDKKRNNFWLFFSHTFPQKIIDGYVNSAKSVGTEKEKHIKKHASLYYFTTK